MMILILLVVCWLELGVFGRWSQVSPLTPNLLLVFLWAVSWFSTRRNAWRLAIWGGLLIDLAGFGFFGLWTVTSLLAVLVVNTLKARFLDAASILHALLVLAAVSVSTSLITMAVWHSFSWNELVLGAIANVGLGLIVYYLLAMRLRLFSRWAGHRVE